MDPLSVGLAVISLATAVKDLVELGQKIHESFARVSNNYHSAQRVAKDIKDMVEEIRVFCEDHKDALNNMKDFRLALQGLLDKFQRFETSILPLLPPVADRKRDFLIRSWREWRNSNEVEGRILELQSDTVTVMRTHMMKSAMRIEVKQETNHQETNRGITGIAQGLEVVRRDVSAIRTTTAIITRTHRSYEPTGINNDEFTRNVIMFAQSTPSTSLPMLRTPNVITEELMTTAYIKLQINSIATTVEEMSTLPASALVDNIAPNSLAPFQLSLILNQASMSITHLRHHVVRQVLGIRDLLDTKQIHIISIKEGATAFNELSVGLRTLGMGNESMLVSKWAITLVRLLVNVSGDRQPDLTATLALYLLNQSMDYYGNGNNIQSLQAIEEAYTIAQSLLPVWNQYRGESDFQELYSNILLQYARLVDNQRSIEMCIEAVQILEDILNVQAYTQSNLPGQIQNVVHHGSSFVDNLFSSALSRPTISSYAHALYRLGTFLSVDGHAETALDLQLLAVAVRRKMVFVHGHEHKVELAEVLLWLVRGRTASCIPAEELVDMADECIQLFQELADKNPLRYAQWLVDVLWVKADTLDRLNRNTEAIAAWEEVASLAGQIIQDSNLCARAFSKLSNQFRRLKRHDDAVRTRMLAITTHCEEVEIQAARYFNLSRDLQQLRRYKESADAARMSVALYRRLAMKDPVIWMGHLTESLSDLSHCLAALGDYSEALIAWKESVNILDNFVNTDPDAKLDVFDRYLAALDIHRHISSVLEDEAECLEVCFTAVQYLRRLSGFYPQNVDIIQNLLRADFRHTYNMFCVGRLQDAHQYIAHWIDVWNGKPEAIRESEIMAWHAAMVILKAEILNAQGCTQEALLTTRKVPDIMGLSATTYQFSYSQMIYSMVYESSLQVNLGNSEKALQVAEEALRLSRDNKLGQDVYNLVWSLHAVAFTALSCQDYKRAIEAAQEGCKLSASPNWEGNFEDISMRPSLFAIWSSAEANLGRCSTALEYAHDAVNALLDIRDRKADIPATVAEHSYMETRGSLADILVATDDLAQARQICEERRVYFSKRVEKRAGEYRDLAPILRMLGVLCCNEGRHEEGDAAAKELLRIMTTLESVFPSLREQVMIRLRNQAKVPILKVVGDMSQKLDCEHQAEVLSLFEI